MMSNVMKLVVLAMGTLLLGCASSAVDESFGDAVRATMAEQRVAPHVPADDAEIGMDGQRGERVIDVYRGVIGNPTTVVGGQAVERE